MANLALATLLLGLSATLALECPAPPPPTPPAPLLGCENEEVPVYTPANAGDQNNPREVPSGTSENRYGCPFKVTNMSASDDEIFLKVHQCRASPCQCCAIALGPCHLRCCLCALLADQPYQAGHDLQGCVCLVAARTQDGTQPAPAPADAHGHGAWDRWDWQGQTGAPITFMGMRGVGYYRPWAGQYYYQATSCGRQSPVSGVPFAPGVGLSPVVPSLLPSGCGRTTSGRRAPIRSSSGVRTP